MNHCYTLQILYVLLLLITLISGRALYYDELDQNDNTKLHSSDEEDGQDRKLKVPNILYDNGDNNDDDDTNDRSEFDSYEERKFHQRALFSTSRPSHAISAQTRQALIDILQKAIDQGWRPSLKHYMPATRFGRHRR